MLFIGKKSTLIQGRSFNTSEPTDLSDVTFTPWLIKVVLQSVEQNLISPIDQEARDLLNLASKNTSQLSIGGSGSSAPADPVTQGVDAKYWGTLDDLAAMVALTAKRGDWCIRADVLSAWVLVADDPELLANWIEIPKGAGGGTPSYISTTPIVDQSYTFGMPTEGSLLRIPEAITDYQIHAAGPLQACSIQLPDASSTIDGQEITVGTTYDIASLTILLNNGQFANPAGLPTHLLAGTTFKFKWYTRWGMNMWVRRA